MIRALAITLALTLTACASETTEPKPKADKDDGAALVAKRYGDCLKDLDAGKPKNQGMFVIVKIPDGELTFSTNKSKTGDTLTFPFDEFTTEQLESVGC
jgi:hypothetical protein